MTVAAKTGVGKKLTTAEVAKAMAEVPEVSIGQFVSGLQAEFVPYFVTRLAHIVRVSASALKQAEQRIALEEIVRVGGEWVDKETGLIHEFKGTPGDWDCLDPDGFYAALIEAGVSPSLANSALPQKRALNNTILNSLRDGSNNAKDKKVAKVIEDFRSRKKSGPPHLRPKE